MVRIVKLTFNPADRPLFIDLLEKYKHKIRSFPGCGGVQFLNDRQHPTIFFTYSHWDSPDSLEAYRQSPLFREVWSQVKPWFADKPEAWSVEELEE